MKNAPKHLMADWLGLHQLEAAQCWTLLQHGLEQRAKGPQVKTLGVDLDAVQAWQLAATALTQAFPDLADLIAAVHSNTRTEFDVDAEKYPRAFTLHGGENGYPVVVCAYRPHLRDLLTLAHEFGHALQIKASGAAFMPPAYREVCAFVAEQALLRHCPPKWQQGMQQIWQQATGKYLGADLAQLQDALHAPGSPYTYRWNYPVARILAIRHMQDRDLLQMLFQGDWDQLSRKARSK